MRWASLLQIEPAWRRDALLRQATLALGTQPAAGDSGADGIDVPLGVVHKSPGR